ncbi:ZIP family metal transporter [Candidatus Woesearchaeota archaeon]|nr:ZIP family metal transporter [Candidatus Woesearchaeota archaeon]
MLYYILFSIGIISLISLSGALFLAKRIEKNLFFLVSFAIGAMLGAAFFDLLPEAPVYNIVLVGILFFFVLEKMLHWHHHHYERAHKHCCHVQPYAYLNLIGDGVHNFIDGMVIASAYLTEIPLGISVTIAIAFHEIPQEMGDLGVLLHSGLSKAKAVGYNLISAGTSFLGGGLVYFFSLQTEGLEPILLAFAAGGFIYIAIADLMPELHKERDIKKSALQTSCILLGIAVIWLTTQL